MNDALAPDSAAPAGSPSFPFRLRLLPAVPMTQAQFFDFCQQNPEVRFERTAQGELIVMPPSEGESGLQELSVGAQLYAWAKVDGTGKAFSSSTGYELPSGANRSPDASWVSLQRLAALSGEQLKKFLPLCPDFFVEVLSTTDSVRQLMAKMEEFIANGARLGWLINPRNKQVHVYRPQQAVQVVENASSIAADPELPGFVLDLECVWQP